MNVEMADSFSANPGSNSIVVINSKITQLHTKREELEGKIASIKSDMTISASEKQRYISKISNSLESIVNEINTLKVRVVNLLTEQNVSERVELEKSDMLKIGKTVDEKL